MKKIKLKLVRIETRESSVEGKGEASTVGLLISENGSGGSVLCVLMARLYKEMQQVTALSYERKRWIPHRE